MNFILQNMTIPSKRINDSITSTGSTGQDVDKKFSFDDLARIGSQAVTEKNKERDLFNKRLKQKNMMQIASENGLIPARYASASLNLSSKNIPDQLIGLKKQYQSGINYVSDFSEIEKTAGYGLFLWGKVGSGKTHLACAIANALAGQNKTAVYTTVTELVSVVMSSKSFANKQDEHETLKKFMYPDLLIIDEIGSGYRQLSAFEVSILFSVVDMRYRNCKPIIGISNQSPDQAVLSVGEMTMSRLTGNGAKVLYFDSQDLRKSLVTNNEVSVTDSLKKRVKCFDEDAVLLGPH